VDFESKSSYDEISGKIDFILLRIALLGIDSIYKVGSGFDRRSTERSRRSLSHHGYAAPSPHLPNNPFPHFPMRFNLIAKLQE